MNTLESSERSGGEPGPNLRLSLVVLTYARDQVLRDMLAVLKPLVAGRLDYELVLVDNNADGFDRSPWLEGFNQVTLLRMSSNRGVIARNDGIAAARGRIIGVLDDDVFLKTENFIDILDDLFTSDPKLGVVTIRKLVRDTGDTRSDLIPHTRKNLDMLRPFLTFRFVGGFVAFRRSMVEEVGAFSPEFFYGLEEIEYSYRVIEAGWRIRYSPEIVAIELEHPAGRRPTTEVQTMRLTNKYIMSYIHMPFPQIILNYVFFTPYAFMKSGGRVKIVRAIAEFGKWLGRKERPQRRPIGREAIAYIRSCGGSTWR